MANRENTIKTNVELDVSNAEKGIEKLNDVKDKSIDLDKKSAKAQGTLAKAMGKTDEATGGLLASMKALVLSPVGLVVTALVGAFKFLGEAVSRSGKASKTFSKIGAKLGAVFNGLLAVVEPLVEFIGDKLLNALNDPRQAIQDLGDSIKENLQNRIEGFMKLGKAFSLLLKGEFKEAAEVAGDALLQAGTGVENFGDKVKEALDSSIERFDEAAAATERLANAEKRLARNRIAAEKQQLISLRLAEEERQARDDVTKSIDERIEANKRLGKILEDQAMRELAIAQQNLNIARDQMAATGDTIENIEAVGDAEIKLLEIRERITGQRSEQLVNENALLLEQQALKDEQKKKEEEDELKAKEKKDQELQKSRDEAVAALEQQIEFDELEKERLTQLGLDTNEIEKEIIDNKAAIQIAAKQRTEDELFIINEKARLAKQKIDNATIKAEKEKEAAILDSAINGAAEAFGITQEVATARMLIAAPEAVSNIFRTAAAQPTIISRVAHVVSGLSTVVPPIIQGLQTIKNTRFSKKKGAAPSGSISVPTGGGGGGGRSSSITPEVVNDLAANSSARLGLDTSIGSGASADASNNVLGGSSSNIVFSESRFNDFRNQVRFKEDKTTIS